MSSKICATCQQTKNIDQFGIHNRRKGPWIGAYVKSVCKQCLSKKNIEYYNEHIDTINAQTICECGSLQYTYNMKRHLQTPRHKKLLEYKK